MKSKDFETLLLNQLSECTLKLGLTRNTVKLYNNHKKQLQFKTPVLRIPFGVNINKFKTYSSYNEYYMECSVDDDFVSEFQKFESKLFPLLLEHPDYFKTTFEQPPTLENIQQYWKSPIRSNDYGHLLKVTLPRNITGDFDFTIWDHNSEQLNVDDSNITQLLSKHTKFTSVLRINKLWGFKEQYGLILHLEQLKLTTPEDPQPTEVMETKQTEEEESYLLLD